VTAERVAADNSNEQHTGGSVPSMPYLFARLQLYSLLHQPSDAYINSLATGNNTAI